MNSLTVAPNQKQIDNIKMRVRQGEAEDAAVRVSAHADKSCRNQQFLSFYLWLSSEKGETMHN